MNMYDERVGFGRRFGSYMLDFLTISIFGLLISSLAGEYLVELFFGSEMAEIEATGVELEDMGFDYEGIMTKVMRIGAGTSIVTLLFFILEGLKGQSVGKMILKIENTAVSGQPADAKTLWIRSFLKYASTILSLVGGLVGLSFIGTIGSIWGGIIFIGFFFAFSEKKQTIHDMIAKTVVSWK